MNFDGPPAGRRTQQKSLALTAKSELAMVESQELSKKSYQYENYIKVHDDDIDDENSTKLNPPKIFR